MFEDIAGELRERVLVENEILLKEGEDNLHVYILKEGALVVTIEGDEVCRVCTPESVFGEISVLMETAPTATVTALEPTTVWVIEDLPNFMADHPTFAVDIGRELAKRLYNMNLNLLEARSALQNLEDGIREQAVSGNSAPLSTEEIERMKHPDAGQAGIVEEPDDMITVKRGQPIIIKGLMAKVDEALKKRVY